MLWITRKVFRDACGDKNCTIIDLPGGGRVRVWLLSNGHPGSVRMAIDAPRDCRIARGELLPPFESQPDTPRPVA